MPVGGAGPGVMLVMAHPVQSLCQLLTVDTAASRRLINFHHADRGTTNPELMMFWVSSICLCIESKCFLKLKSVHPPSAPLPAFNPHSLFTGSAILVTANLWLHSDGRLGHCLYNSHRHPIGEIPLRREHALWNFTW
jgi:hypothetical protein